MKIKFYAREKAIMLAIVALLVFCVGCQSAHKDAAATNEYPAMSFAPKLTVDKCEEQELVTADCSGFMGEGAGQAKNVILLIGDGMGPNQVFAARVLVNGPDKQLQWEMLPNKGSMTTCAEKKITDSAAAATAMATGNKTQDGVLAMQLTPKEKKLTNISDIFHSRKAIGIVTTSKVWDATPAGFTAHSPSRDLSKEIANEIITVTKPEVVLGGGREAFLPKKTGKDLDKKDLIEAAKKEGYTYVSTQAELTGLGAEKPKMLLGLFSDGYEEFEVDRKAGNTEPHLNEMAMIALDILSRDERGFFVMIEGGRIDHACHITNENKLSGELIEFNKTVVMVLEWAKNHPDTLVLVAADHETGGTKIVPRDYKKGDMLDFDWKYIAPNVSYHSGTQVRVFGIGPNSSAIKDHIDNTELFCIEKNAFGELK